MAGRTGKESPRKRIDAPRELKEKCEAYFTMCDELGRKYTRPGLALFLGVEPEIITTWAEDTSVKNAETARVIKLAVARMTDALEQRTDSMATFLIKQPCYGGYRDRISDSGDSTIHISVSFGKKAGKQVADYGK